MSQPTPGSHLHVRAAFAGRDVHALLCEILGRKKKPASSENRREPQSEVVASFSTKDDTLTLSSLLYGRLPIEFSLKPNSRSYESFLRLLLEELRRVSQEEKTSGKSTDRKSVAQLTSHIERKIRAFADSSSQTLNKNGSRFNGPAGFGPNGLSTNGLAEVIDVFRDDVEAGAIEASVSKERRPRQRPLLSRKTKKEHGFRFVRSEEESPQLISGFLSLEVDEESSPARADEAPLTDWYEAEETLKRSFRVVSGRLLDVQNSKAMIEFICEVPTEYLGDIRFLVHWGRYSGPARGWWDEEIAASDIQRIAFGQTGRRWKSRRRVANAVVRVESLKIRKEIDVELDAQTGSFGAVLSVELRGGGERCWGNIPGMGDLCFQVTGAQARIPIGTHLPPLPGSAKEEGIGLSASLSSFEKFISLVGEKEKEEKQYELARSLASAIRWNPALRESIAEYGRRAALAEVSENGSRELNPRKKRSLRTAAKLVQNLGVGGVVIVAPEGPQAIAGGLAQVVVGLTSVFNSEGVATTIISPLYEESQGSKHRSAKEMIQDGVILEGKRCPLTLLGSIRIPFGPEFDSGTSQKRRNAEIVVAEVYEAKNKLVRTLFLRHRQLADKLYSAVDSSEQIRRAIFLSRGALELMRDESFSIFGDAVITNDWLTGLVPVYLKTHPRYNECQKLRSIPVVHMIHNGGHAYQGRFFTNQFGRDLWPMFDLSEDHFFGLSDPNDRRYLNLSAGAVFHTNGALLAVSKPYAESLLTPKGGEGLQSLFRSKRHLLFGVSNGIDLHELRKFAWQVGEEASRALGRTKPLLPRFRSDGMLSRLSEYKWAAKQVVQSNRGLIEDPSAILISLVGRLAEQKGIRLLVEPGEKGEPSLMELILQEFPCAQFLLAGPLSLNDPAAKLFSTVVEDLVERYPGRVQSAFSFLPHREALEITLGSNLFLMPSRYEPGGITQLEALACGTPVVARKIGGIAATVSQYDPTGRMGTGFLFEEYRSRDFHQALREAIVTVGDPRHRLSLLRCGALAENDWSNRAEAYLALLQHVVGALSLPIETPTFGRRRQLLIRSRG